MFGLRLITKRELALYAAQIQDVRAENERLKQLAEHERKRAEGAINALLIKAARIAITPDTGGMTYEQEQAITEKTLDIFGDGANYSEDEALKKLQS